MSATTRICVTGGDGLLATALRDYFPHATFLSHRSLDVGNYGQCKQHFSQHPYDLIIHCGAVTSAAAPPETFIQTNIVGTCNIVQWARKQNARLVYTSTDYVYPGTGQHKESDPVLPVNGYAWSKLGGEAAVRQYANSVVIRGSWYGDLSLQHRATTDGYTSKVPVEKAAYQIAAVSTSSLTGTVHVGGPRRSFYEIVVTEANPRCRPMTRAEAGLPYRLPADVSLDLTRVKRVL